MKPSSPKFSSVLLAGILFAFSFQAQRAAAQAPELKLIGTWKLHLAKSKFHSGPPPETITIHTWWWDGDSLKHKAERVNQKGETVSVGGLWTAKFDGKDRLIGGDGESQVNMKRIDAFTTQMTEGSPGRPKSLFKQAVSKDGKTLTITRRTEGKDVEDILVHDRQ